MCRPFVLLIVDVVASTYARRAPGCRRFRSPSRRSAFAAELTIRNDCFFEVERKFNSKPQAPNFKDNVGLGDTP